MSFAKEKAEELVNKFYKYDVIRAKDYALITINEMLDFRNALFINQGSLIHQHLLDVKSEIEKL